MRHLVLASVLLVAIGCTAKQWEKAADKTEQTSQTLEKVAEAAASPAGSAAVTAVSGLDGRVVAAILAGLSAVGFGLAEAFRRKARKAAQQ